MNQFLGLNLNLSLNDGTQLEGSVHSINDRTQELSLKSVKLFKNGSVVGRFPELTVNGKEIKDVEIVNSSNEMSNSHYNEMSNNHYTEMSKSQYNSTRSTINKNGNAKTFTNSASSSAKTFPTGNVRQTLPAEDFDFVASLQRFDKAKVFSEIAQKDLVRPEERLVSINSPQRKLGINEDVLEGREAKNSIVRAQERKAQIEKIEKARGVEKDRIIENAHQSTVTKTKVPVEKLLGLSLQPQPTQRSVLIVEDSESEEIEDSSNFDTFETFGLPEGKEGDQLSSEECLISALNLAQYLLPSLLTKPPAMLLVLLGIEQESGVVLQMLSHLTKHNRIPPSCQIYACFAVGGTGQRIELPLHLKTLKSQLIGRVQFISSLSEVCIKAAEAENVWVFEALKDRTEKCLSVKTVQTMTALLQDLLKLPGNRVFSFNGSILRKGDRLLRHQLVSIGLPQWSVFEAMPLAESLLIVGTGGEREDADVDELFKETFVCEIEY